jgi:hypothetical protein
MSAASRCPIPAAESRITECPAYVRVDFGNCDCSELFETYRSFADRCNDGQVNGALLMAGDTAPEGHRQLREALSSMARTIASQPEFKLAMVASTPAVKAVYREAQRLSRAIGLNAWVFDTVYDAVEWLEGRAASGQTAS